MECNLSYNEKEKKIVLQREVNGEVADEISFPTRIDGDQLLDRLFPSELIDNPSREDREADAWSRFHLGLMKISWHQSSDVARIGY